MNNIMLIVDDVEMNREILKVLFHSSYGIMEAQTGEEALEILERCQGSIDIVLLDLVMPGMSGFDLLKKKHELEFFRNVPVVVITGSGHMEDQVRAFELGANDFVSKPLIPEIVISRVNNVMSSNRRMLSMALEAEKLKVKSEVDAMTGLYNKETTEYAINQALNESGDKLDVLMIIDIDNFKTVNDTSGHQAGDHVIKIIADLISGHFRKSDIVGRIGGDEFCVLMTDVPSMQIAHMKINELIQTMRYKPNLTIPEYVTLSIGVVNNNKKSTSYPELFKKADSALYEAKNDGKARYREYGVKPISMDHDNRPAAVLLSNNRSTCSIVHSLLPARIRIIEALKFEDLEKISEGEKQKVKIMYADVSDQTEDTTSFWQKIKEMDWIPIEHVFAICQEGRINQYMEALKSGVGDLLTAPIEDGVFKRRTGRMMEQLHLIESEKEHI